MQNFFRGLGLVVLATSTALSADLLPDLTIDGTQVAAGIFVDRNEIPGATLLRMPTVVPNIGQGAMEIRGGQQNSDGTRDVYQRIYQSDGGVRERLAGTFIYHPTHGHIHFEDFAQFRLCARNSDGSVGAVLREGSKISFCLLDVNHISPGLPGSPANSVYNDCSDERQGISVGWADIYGAYLDDQWIDITGVAPGQYWIEVMTDPVNHLVESNESNNSAFIPYTIGGLDNVVTGTVYDDRNANGVRDADEPGLAGWRAFLDLNGNGVRDKGVTTVNAIEVPSSILDTRKALHELEVSGIQGVITDLKVKIRITHTWDADLAVTLISPSGRRVLLIDNVGDSGDNFTDTVLTDETSASISTGRAPFTARFKPLQPLSLFDNESPNGHWKLEIDDQAADDVGQLLAWSLEIAHSEPQAITDSAGAYRIASWSDGPVSVRVVRKTGWTDPTPASRAVTLSGGTISDQNFSFRRASIVTGVVFNDANGNAVRETGEVGLGGWRVYDDVNNNSVYDNSSEVSTRNAADLPLPIADFATVSSSLSVSGLSGLISDIDISIDLLHSFTGDLALTLVAPKGERVKLFNRYGVGGKNITTTLNDEAGTAISTGIPPYVGSFKPSEPLSRFDGINPNGTWRLEVADLAAGDSGIVRAWSLRISHGSSELSTTTLSNGSYTLDQLQLGSHRICVVEQSNWMRTTPSSGGYVFTFTAASTGVANFGNIVVPSANN